MEMVLAYSSQEMLLGCTCSELPPCGISCRQLSDPFFNTVAPWLSTWLEKHKVK